MRHDWGRVGLSAICGMALASASFGQKSDAYFIFDVGTKSQSDVDRLLNSPARPLACEPQPGVPTRVAMRKDEILGLYALNLPLRFVGNQTFELPGSTVSDGFDYRNEYGDYATLMSEWESLRAQNPHLVQRRQVGASLLGEPIYAYRIFNQIQYDVQNPPASIVIVGATHAREWISPSVVLHIGKSLVNEFNTADNDVTTLLTDRVALYVIPIVNPDGYKHTWTTERLWRKNRRQNTSTTWGVDINRNYAKAWSQTSGSSTNPASEIYKGTGAFSEPETQAVRTLVTSARNLKAFIDYHSYGEKILWPWSYTTTQCPTHASHLAKFTAVRNAMVDAGGRTYTIGAGAPTLYVASGTSKDWVLDTRGGICATIELRNTTTFELPVDQITPTQNESWVGFKELVRQVAP